MQRLRREGEFPQLVWKDTPPQHFETEFGEYPEEQPKPPMEVPAPCPSPANEGALHNTCP